MAVAEAARLLIAGEVVALPTETVYGLAANAWSAAAVRRIYAAKGRPSTNPLIIHVADEAMLTECVTSWPAGAVALARTFWPGPLTLVLPANVARVPAEIRAGGATVAVRWPAHPLMQAVIRACGFPLAAPSANPSNSISPTTAQHVQTGLGACIPLIVDGGPSTIGIESTVVDCTGPAPVVLRPGAIGEDEVRRVWAEGQVWGVRDEVREQPRAAPTDVLRSPGQLVKHYAPRAPLAILTWTTEADLRHQLAARGWAAAGAYVIAYQQVPAAAAFARVEELPAEPRGYAQHLYAALHRADEAGATCVIVEAPPAPLAWAGIRDRLRRAAS
ncbi:MAG: threonylcarbamoyl-AMP synthase [Hymenobacteraceae bacterium]|nr:threonylcarbamoyl-AMP synthase [Hymenobacteraceae bacterium]